MEQQANYIQRIEIHGLWDRYNIAWNQHPFRHQRSREDHHPQPFRPLSGRTFGRDKER